MALALALVFLLYTLTTLIGDHWTLRTVWGGLSLLAGWNLLKWFKAKDGKFFAYYLMHDYAFGAATRGANTPALEARMAEFGEAIAEALTSEVDEVLVVGHSSGAHLGVSVLSDLIRVGRVPADGPALGFLSLGQVVLMVSFLEKAYRLRADLAYLSASDALTWVDVTAPGDGCAFALCDPVAVSGVAPEGKRCPLVQPLSRNRSALRGGRRCAGGFSVCTSNICTPLMRHATTTISRSLRGQ